MMSARDYLTILFSAAISASWSQYAVDGVCCDPDSYYFDFANCVNTDGVDGWIDDTDCPDYCEECEDEAACNYLMCETPCSYPEPGLDCSGNCLTPYISGGLGLMPMDWGGGLDGMVTVEHSSDGFGGIQLLINGELILSDLYSDLLSLGEIYIWQSDYGDYFMTDFVLHLFTNQDQALEEIYTPCGLNSYEFVYLPPESSGCLPEVVLSGTYEVSCGCADEAACNYSGDSNFYREQCFYLDDCAVCGGQGECFGCTDTLACNFSPQAEFDDGSCLQFDDCGVCGGENLSCSGCTFSIACNYNPEATIDDGSCYFLCPGCTNPDACNYDDSALQDDGSCTFPEDSFLCNCDSEVLDMDGDGICDDVDDCVGLYDECGVCNGDNSSCSGCDGVPNSGVALDQCGICGGDGTSCIGCTYEFACNYDSSYTILDPSSCEFGTCSGCTILGACNYNPTLSVDDGSCEWCSCNETQPESLVSVEPVEARSSSLPIGYWLEMETVIAHSGGTLDGQTTYRLYMNMQNETDYMSSCSGDSENPLILTSTTGEWYNDAAATTWNAQGLNPVFFTFFPELAFDSFLTIGAEDATTPATQHPVSVWSANDPTTQFVGGPGNDITVDDASGGAWYTPFPGAVDPNGHVAFAGADLRVLLAQFTTAGIINGQLQVQVFVEGNQGNEFRALLPICQTGECGGCTDEMASNYDSNALYDDGTCSIPGAGCTNSSACNYDSEAITDDGTCYYDTCVGCTDIQALNYCPAFTIDDGSCIYEYLGCMDASACNYLEEANFDDGNQCQYILADECDCEGNVLDECGVCGGNGIPEGQCDCEGNILDECGICGGQGIPQGECDCEGNVLDECGVCGGEGIPEGACDCEGNVLDECGVCGGEGIQEGQCDCEGNLLDALGVCGGDCLTDQNNNGICDLTELENPVGGPETCGLGTVWDEETQTCIVANPADINFDGCVQLNDLLDLLSAYGLCQTAEAAWSCGDPLEYQGHDYATVLIGDHCWFAENLRSENYENGDAIPSDLSVNEWAATTSGATTVYGESSSNLESYGHLYNWFAVEDGRGLCPSGWHIPTDGELMTMEMVLGMSEAEVNSIGWRGTNQGTQMKNDLGWANGGNGTNSSGFSGKPGGYRSAHDGTFSESGNFGYWWSASAVDLRAWSRYLGGNQELVRRNDNDLNNGFSVRCLQDAE